MIRPVKRSACFITPLIMTTGVFIMLLLSANLSIKRCRPANTDVLPLQRLQVPDTSRYAADKNPGKADNPSSPERTSCGNTRIIKLRPADEPAVQGTTVISFVPQDTGIEVRLFAIVANQNNLFVLHLFRPFVHRFEQRVFFNIDAARYMTAGKKLFVSDVDDDCFCVCFAFFSVVQPMLQTGGTAAKNKFDRSRGGNFRLRPDEAFENQCGQTRVPDERFWENVCAGDI